ncbi:hypothetical protein MMC12_006831 [Toensbergia leucococca]|nr:hypothetical protein [Toensbergia leucococca]
MCNRTPSKTLFTIAGGFTFSSDPPRRTFHNYFVTHLPTSSLHPDSHSASGPGHGLPRSASKPHTPSSSKSPSPAPLVGVTRDTTVVRIPIRSAKHHFGVSVSRGTRPYNEDSYQAGVIELPAFAKRAPLNLTSRAPASSPLQAYRADQRKKLEEQQAKGGGDGEGTSAESASGDPQVFYFGVFDGHGGAECSDFLKERLHNYIEDAAEVYGLESTLKAKAKIENKPVTGGEAPSSSAGQEKDKVDNPEKPQENAANIPANLATSPYTRLQSTLLSRWADQVGGYFSRFHPPAFTPPTPPSPPTASTVLTHAFLNADLDFILAQSRKRISANDDAPLNASDILHSPSIGGPLRFAGGSTCSLALISTPTPTPFWHPSSPSTLLIAHVGDTRILLCRTADGKACPQTTDHHPSSPGEASRLRRSPAAQFVTDSFGEERMSGLANTRAFGDMQSKRLGVSAEPELRRVEVAPAEYAFMVLVSDGVSGTVGDQEIVDLVKEAKTPEQGAKDVVGYATEVSREGDNCTCLVVRMGGWERRSEGGGGGMGTREAREWRRKEAADPRSRIS